MSEKKGSIRDLAAKYFENPELNGDKLVAKLQSMKETWVGERDKTNARIWRNSVAFYAGNHYVRDLYNTSNAYRVRVRENHINNIMNRLLSVVVQNMPIVRCFPATDSAQDVQDAQNTEAYGKYFWRIKRLESQLSKYVRYSLIFGNAFSWRGWNPDLGGKMVLNPDETETGEKEIESYRGDIEFHIDDPFKVAVRPGIDEWLDHYDILRSVPVSRAMLEGKFGEIEADPAVVLNSQTGDYRIDEDNIVLNHYYHKPTPWFEEGLYVAWAGKKILKARPATKSEIELPVTFMGFDKVPMKFWHLSSIEQVMDLQEQLNRAASMIIEARNLVARPRVLASNQSKVPTQSLSDRPGEVIRYDAAGGVPQFHVPPFNFAELAAHKGDVRDAIGMVTGMTMASRGEIPAATRTALALQLVLEQDRSQYLPYIKNFHQSILDVMNGIFSEAAANIDESDPRTIKIEGKIRTTRTFHGGMVPSPLDLYLEDTNPLGWTSAGRVEQIQEIAKMGLIRDPNTLLEMLHINSADPAYESANINRQSQQKENELLDRGEPVEVNIAENHAIHLEEIDKVMASFEFRYRPQPIKDLFHAHRQAHVDMMQQAAAPMPAEGQIRPAGADLGALSDMGAAPQPGENLEKLLTSARAG